jgi:molybdopterin-containing oxidoreductase family iron-sulfur binding subunit
VEREFPAGAAEFDTDEVSRRHFIKLMGASTALAGLGLAACRRPTLELVPFSHGAEWSIPSKPVFYTSSMPSPRGSIPLIVTTNDGRPTKIEGNPLHPLSNGGTDVFAQASILSLYDPDRSREFLQNGQSASEKQFLEYLEKLLPTLKADGGAGLAFVVETSTSPTRERLRGELEKQFPQARWCAYEPLGDELFQQAAQIGFGDGVLPMPVLSKADVIVALDADFLNANEGTPDLARDFSARRRVEKVGDKMNRLYAVENRFTITGGMADHRLRLPASQIGAFAVALAKKLNDPALLPLADAIAKSVAGVAISDAWVSALADDLLAAKGRSLILVGARQPVAVQLLGFAINQVLGNVGLTLVGKSLTEKPSAKLADIASDINDKKLTCLVVLGGNPAFNAPADFNWDKLQDKVPNIIRFGMYVDETSQGAHWQVPAAHYLEAWGDGRAADGSYVSVQPMIMPLFGGWSELDLLAVFAGLLKPKSAELIQDTFRQLAPSVAFDDAWVKFLHDGFLAGSATGERPLFFQTTAAAMYVGEHNSTPALVGEEAFEVVLVADSKLIDGRYANLGWLQEMPDPVTQLTWDNAALVSPATAKKLGVREHRVGVEVHDVIEIVFEDQRRLEIVALPVPGHADHSITIALGYGRKVPGYISKGAGVNAYPLRTSSEPYIALGAKVRKTDRTYPLALAQDESHMQGSLFVREATLEQYAEHPDFAQTAGIDAHAPGSVDIYTRPTYNAPNQWGMVVDLNICTGCNACVVACQAENNIPVVGKDQVLKGRRMPWIRMDRYFASQDNDDTEPEMVIEPIMCQQCESAPCEAVCPVNATVHSDDGLNVMAYNRCIGTRYCANNCPFKVRRFNFFNYNERPIQNGDLYKGPLTHFGMADTLKMQKNPNVTVRMRGVMEKCTFCVQRIEMARIATKVKAGASDDITIPVDSFKSACQQACPSEAIVFGDIKNPESRVSKLRAQDRNYELLKYLNLNTRVTYLARLRNPNPKMPGADRVAGFEWNVKES